MGIFLLILPSLVIGPQFNGECLGTWWHQIMSPFLTQGASSPQEINQSMVGVLTRLLTDTETGTGRYDVRLDLNLVAWPPRTVRLLIKAISVGMLVLLAWLCRTKTTRRDDPRLLGEFALVVMAMLFLSERSWKHHFVTLLLPYTYLLWQFADGPLRWRGRLAITAAVWGSVLFMATTSTELGGLFGRTQGHKIAQGYGMFLWAAMLLFVATAWRVAAERNRELSVAPEAEAKRTSWAVPSPHFSEGWRTANPPR